MQTYRMGDTVIFKVLEREMSIPKAELYPDYLQPEEGDRARQKVPLSIHSWVIRTPTILL